MFVFSDVLDYYFIKNLNLTNLNSNFVCLFVSIEQIINILRIHLVIIILIPSAMIEPSEAIKKILFLKGIWTLKKFLFLRDVLTKLWSKQFQDHHQNCFQNRRRNSFVEWQAISPSMPFMSPENVFYSPETTSFNYNKAMNTKWIVNERSKENVRMYKKSNSIQNEERKSYSKQKYSSTEPKKILDSGYTKIVRYNYQFGNIDDSILNDFSDGYSKEKKDVAISGDKYGDENYDEKKSDVHSKSDHTDEDLNDDSDHYEPKEEKQSDVEQDDKISYFDDSGRRYETYSVHHDDSDKVDDDQNSELSNQNDYDERMKYEDSPEHFKSSDHYDNRDTNEIFNVSKEKYTIQDQSNSRFIEENDNFETDAKFSQYFDRSNSNEFDSFRYANNEIESLPAPQSNYFNDNRDDCQGVIDSGSKTEINFVNDNVNYKRKNLDEYSEQISWDYDQPASQYDPIMNPDPSIAKAYDGLIVT